MKRNIYLLLALLVTASCGVDFPSDPACDDESVTVTIPFVCTYLGITVLEGYLAVREEDVENYDINDLLQGSLSCSTEQLKGLNCVMAAE
jgi:hypothetical protein